MDVEIGQLKEYPKLYELAVNYAIGDGVSLGDIDITTIDNMIFWDDTNEGGDFWCSVNNGDFDDAKRMYPELFERSMEHITTTNNGLFI